MGNGIVIHISIYGFPTTLSLVAEVDRFLLSGSSLKTQCCSNKLKGLKCKNQEDALNLHRKELKDKEEREEYRFKNWVWKVGVGRLVSETP